MPDPPRTWATDRPVSLAVGRRMVAVARSGEEYFAIEDVCTHDGAELTGGEIEGAEIICPRHGARFCLRTGEALTPPAYEPVRVFATKIEVDICGYAQTDAVASRRGAGHRQPAGGLRARVDAPRQYRGARDGERIVHRNLIPDLILVSPAERAWAPPRSSPTACELDAKQVQCARELYLATPETTWRLLARCDPAPCVIS